jgi:hypothetical protein
MGLLENLCLREFGLRTGYRESAPGLTVGTTVVELLPNNPDRVAFTVVNYGAGWVVIGFDNEISANRGIYLASGGGGVNIRWREEFELVGARVWALAQNLATPIYFLEVYANEEI